MKLSCVCNSQVTSRVKAQNSIEYKIQRYKTDLHEFGKIPVNKCINDLFGIRIFLDPAVPFEDIYTFVDVAYQQKYRCIDSSKYDYRAVHMYYKKNNRSFPWELQIWNKCDAVNNFASHKKYKQDYTTWEKVSRKEEPING